MATHDEAAVPKQSLAPATAVSKNWRYVIELNSTDVVSFLNGPASAGGR
jgi:hypothetical protein